MTRPPSLPYLMKSGGRWYFRRGGALVRLPDPSDDSFLAAYDAAKRGKPRAPSNTSIAGLIVSYKASSLYAEKSPRTRRGYDRALAYLHDKIGARDVSFLTTPMIVEMMQANAAAGRYEFSNLLLAVVAVLCRQARLIGWMSHNPTQSVPKIRMPADRQRPHVPWPDTVADLWRREAKPMPLLAFEIGVGTMQRPADWTRFRWSDFDGTALRLTQGKTGAELTIPCTPRLVSVLNATPRKGFTILTGAGGRALSYKNLSEMMLRERRRLGTEAYDLHALRYLGIMELAWAGCTDDEIMSYSGHATKAMVAKYAGKARQTMRARQAAEKRERNRPATKRESATSGAISIEAAKISSQKQGE